MVHCLIIGAGAIGGSFGVYLARSTGVEVTFLARGRQYEALRQGGITVFQGRQELRVPHVTVIDNLAKRKATLQWVLVCVKSYDTDEVIATLKPHVGQLTQIVSLQNGIENYEKFLNAFGENRVMRAFCKITARAERPGLIRVESDSGTIVFGEEDGRPSTRSLEFSRILDEAGIPYNASKDIKKDTWKKFIWNCIFNIQSLVFRTDPRGLYVRRDARILIQQQVKEIERLAEAEGVSLPPNTISIPSMAKARAFWLKRMVLKNLRLRSATIGLSTFQDYERGKELETDAFLGACLRLGKKHNIDLPVTLELSRRVETIRYS